MQFTRSASLVLVSLFGLLACDAGAFVGVQGVETPVGISVDLGQLSVGGVSVEVTGPGIDQPIVATLPVTDSVAAGQLTVLAGSDRAFLIRAFDMQGVETHRGSDTVDLAADEPKSLSIGLTPLTANVDIDGRIGTYTVAVALANGAVAAGQATQATATVIDPHGDTIQTPQVVWGSSNPAVASVSSDGLVHGLVPGTATIGASYQGFGGVAALTVQ